MLHITPLYDLPLATTAHTFHTRRTRPRFHARTFFFFKAVLTSNRPQTTWFCPSAATQLRAGLRLPIGCTTIQPVPRNESRAVPWRGRGLLHPSQVRRTTSAHVLLPANPVYLLENSRCFVVALVRLVTVSPWPGVGSRLGTPYLFVPPIARPPFAPRPASPSFPCDAVSARCIPALSLLLIRLPRF
jgi:hypothetical protein